LSKPQLLFHSNAPWAPTGYGQQCAIFAPRLAEHYRLSISAFYGLEANAIPWNGIPVLPGMANLYGNEHIQEHAKAMFGDLRGGLVLTLMDVWVLELEKWGRLNTVAWTPVDHDPCPDPVLDFFQAGAVPIAMSRFGEQALAEYDPLYCPHGIETKTYRPYDREESREELGLPKDSFLVGMVAANKGNSPPRKCFQEAFQAFKILNDRHKDARLYVHSEATGRFQGVQLLPLLQACGVKGSSVSLADQYRIVHLPFKDEHMAKVYSSMDVLLAASAGEGFGIPVVEAQACGVPVIVSNFTAQPELVGAGWTVEGNRYYTPMGSWQFRPHVRDIADALLAAYAMSPAGKEKAAKKARQKALEYDADKVFKDHMLPSLKAAAQRYEDLAPIEVKA
jgi:glycosyltransferase involved in cell wall biosynthesis